VVAMFEGLLSVKSFSGIRRHKPVGGSKVLSTFVRQFDHCGTLSAGRQAPCAQTSRLRSLSLFVLSFAGLPCQSSAARALATSSFRGSRSLFELAAFLPCSMVTAPRVAFVVLPHAHRPLVTRFARDRWWGRRLI